MNQERIFTVLKGPHVSEKATVVADQRKGRAHREKAFIRVHDKK
jgi:hypothetical protein